MHTTNLRKVGGSIMLAVPPAILDILHLHAGATVGLALAMYPSREREEKTSSQIRKGKQS